MRNIFISVKFYLINFFKAQAVVLIVSTPILISWGIPLSLMSFVGNLLFTPFLTAFLVLSSLTFFTELLCIPNGYLVYALTTTTSYWELFLSFGKKTWLVGFSKPGAAITFLLIALLLLLTFRLIFKVLSKVVTAAIIIVIASAGFHYTFKMKNQLLVKTDVIPQCNNKLSICYKPTRGLNPQNKNLQLIDTGFFSTKKSPEKFINFELKPYLIKKYGTTKIDKIVLHRPSIRSFNAVEALHKTFTVKEVAIAYTPKKLSRHGWKKFHCLRKKIENDGGVFTRLEQTPG